tara:strand:- start:213 stop:467 length:255 start_codon:yes stop_codon:yes gene_type:complete
MCKMAKIKARNWNAVAAHFRNSAGAMKDRRKGRGGACNTSRDLLDDYYDEDVLVDNSVDVVDLGDNCNGSNSLCIDDGTRVGTL